MPRQRIDVDIWCNSRRLSRTVLRPIDRSPERLNAAKRRDANEVQRAPLLETILLAANVTERGRTLLAYSALHRLTPLVPLPSEDLDHAKFVATWLGKVGRGAPPAQLSSLFERALSKLWDRACVTLGEVTLAAIVDRVLYTATEKYAFLSNVKVDAVGIRFDEFRQEALQYDGLADAVVFVLSEFLTVLGHLTDEILTPALYAVLSNIQGTEPDPFGSSDRKGPGARS